jgi:hypothetical protein
VASSDPSVGDPVEGPGGECGSRFEAVLRREATVSVFRAANCDSGGCAPVAGGGWIGFRGRCLDFFANSLQVKLWNSFD